MAKAFSLASWNVEHFKDDPAERVARVLAFLQKQKPDVFAKPVAPMAGKEKTMSLALPSLFESATV